MKLHTSLTRDDIRNAARFAGVDFHRFEERGSRSRPRAFDVILEGSAGRQGQAGGYEAAAWDEWGLFLAEVFRADPEARAGGYYDGAAHFRWATGGRYDNLTRAGMHRRHKWESQGRSATGSYFVAACPCGAIRRHMAHGYTFGDIAA